MLNYNSTLIVSYLLLFSNFCYAECSIFTEGSLQEVAKIVDGDTIHLVNGTKVRFASINATEIGYSHKPNEVQALNAKQLLTNIISISNNKVRLQPAAQVQDHYGRTIAHVYTITGKNIQEQILRAGLAYTHVYPPNLENIDCYQTAETTARTQRLGLWKIPAINTSILSKNDKGFIHVQGIVQNVKYTYKSIWIELKNLSLRIAQQDKFLFKNFNFDTLKGATLQVRGYLYKYKDKLQIRVRHPTQI
jgi:endonuclease YncB( thermonuclease family)